MSLVDTHGSGPDRTVPSNGEAAFVWRNRRALLLTWGQEEALMLYVPRLTANP